MPAVTKASLVFMLKKAVSPEKGSIDASCKTLETVIEHTEAYVDVLKFLNETRDFCNQLKTMRPIVLRHVKELDPKDVNKRKEDEEDLADLIDDLYDVIDEWSATSPWLSKIEKICAELDDYAGQPHSSRYKAMTGLVRAFIDKTIDYMEAVSKALVQAQKIAG